MKRNIFIDAIIAGLFIGIGGTAFLTSDSKLVGAILFSVGLFAICTFKFNLFTGKVCYALDNNKEYKLNLILIWLGNLIGTCLIGLSLRITRLNVIEKAQNIWNTKLNNSPISILILSILCNILIYLAVEGYKSNEHELGKYMSILFGVIVFIMCGFEHCVANMFYLFVSGNITLKAILYLLLMTLGNTIGGLLIPILRKTNSK